MVTDSLSKRQKGALTLASYHKQNRSSLIVVLNVTSRRTPEASAIREKINRLDYFNTQVFTSYRNHLILVIYLIQDVNEDFGSSKDTIRRVKKPQCGRRYLSHQQRERTPRPGHMHVFKQTLQMANPHSEKDQPH